MYVGSVHACGRKVKASFAEQYTMTEQKFEDSTHNQVYQLSRPEVGDLIEGEFGNRD